MEAVLFYLFGALLLGGAIAAMTSRSAVAAVVWLIFAFVNAAGIYALLAAPVLAILQILIYAGAIMVLFLFVVMMLQGPTLKSELKSIGDRKWWLPVGAVLVALLNWMHGVSLEGFTNDAPAGFGEIKGVAELLLNKYMITFEMISLVLLVAIIGAVALASNKKGMPW
ncbi:MAG: NADH-quinone oxidoreductase subunit J [bacterium]|nr:NADH-quinone oxidoreductase subunit J [bacterium]MCP4798673.1 NADH-quinone oxidoreductase subunit J [bacterium]